ncbi:hypothetical protein [Nannocystis punicea]|uniref:Uncharacterized protein n=1 Tax=Nannocystis punicea TaxID=2995304 RepID=A0ABY7HBK7_9BACT|nr:hypothetical protein [Nannocystis poenicansa]WAS96659.1 hypothetical protein O0S08_10945 [Nannocystis poenicansa]
MDSTNAQVTINKGSLVVFVSAVSEQTQSDVLISTLFAQLAADKKFDRENATYDWYRQYNQVLATLGWDGGSFDPRSWESSNDSFTMDEVILEIAAASLTGVQSQAVAAVLKQLTRLPKTDGRLGEFYREAHSQRRGNFQIAVCTELDGLVFLQDMSFIFETEDEVTDLLSFRFSSGKTKMQTAVQARTLNLQLFAMSRDTTVRKLGGNIASFTRPLHL